MLITGVSGFIASHTANQFLEAGYRVRGTVQDIEESKWMYELFDSKYGSGKFEAVVVPDMATSGAFDEAVKGVDGVVHMGAFLALNSNSVSQQQKSHCETQTS